MNFLHNLDYLLHINKMSRAELARTIGIAPSTINAWYTKDYKGITLKNLVKLSNCFEVTIEDGVYTREQYFKRVNILTEERDALQTNLEALSAISEDKSESVRSAVPILEKCIEQYYNLSILDRNKVLKSIIERIEYTRTDPTRRAPFNLKIYLKI